MLKKIESESYYLLEYLKTSLDIADSIITSVDNILNKKLADNKNTYNSRHFFESYLFTIDNIKNFLRR